MSSTKGSGVDTPFLNLPFGPRGLGFRAGTADSFGTAALGMIRHL